MIRFAQISDTTDIIQLLREFAAESRVGFRHFEQADHDRMVRQVHEWILEHYVRVALVDQQVVGVIIAQRLPDFWDPDRVFLQERAWYVRAQYRSSRVSARLWQAWQQDSDLYLQRDQVQGVLLSTQAQQTPFNPGTRGWRDIEIVWIKEAPWV